MRTADLERALRRVGRPAVRTARKVRGRFALRDAVRTIRRARGVRLVLMYHRVAPRKVPRYEVVPTIPSHLFVEQLHAFGELGRVVPLRELLDEAADNAEPLRVALTFDDDYATHAEQALPVLTDLSLHGTFFLSGRALHGLGGYWFERLEALVAERGLPSTAALLDLEGATEPQLPLRCEGDPARMAVIERHAPAGEAPLSGDGIRALADAGMTIGFHTLHHPVLPRLDDEALPRALTDGRERLAELVGEQPDWFAYPHGKTDDRTLALTRRRYTAAWTTQPRPLRRGDDVHQLGRWEPQPLPTDDVLIRLGRFLEQAGVS